MIEQGEGDDFCMYNRLYVCKYVRMYGQHTNTDVRMYWLVLCAW